MRTRPLFVLAVVGAILLSTFAVLAGTDNSRIERRDCERRLDPSGDFVLSCVEEHWLPDSVRWLINPDAGWLLR